MEPWARVVDPPADARLAAYVGCLDLGRVEEAVAARLAHLAAAVPSDVAARAELGAMTRALTECVGDSDPVEVHLLSGALHLGCHGCTDNV